MDAKLLFYPTEPHGEPHDKTIQSRAHWQRQGQAGANLMPLIASNRIGTKAQDDYNITFYGSSFITDPFGTRSRKPVKPKKQ
ncbi:N-carbamoylputrescine amidase [Pseudomonas duriflava]|uniref:N-carbamoylputrescine amidase n=1 Tax=Pseudomonas duriflava TaxID=459528 RepID=A0A562Q812_9PSED|nr:N-carbamoylputrescine amidase [Pseudomonas duriflava]